MHMFACLLNSSQQGQAEMCGIRLNSLQAYLYSLHLFYNKIAKLTRFAKLRESISVPGLRRLSTVDLWRGLQIH